MSHLINNDPDHVKLRRNRGTLVAVGAGVAAFGIWSILKFLMSILFGSGIEELKELFDGIEEGRTFIIVFTVVFVVIDIILRCRFSYCTVRKGRGQHSGLKYLIPAFIVLIYTLFSFVLMISELISDPDPELYDGISVLVELTSLIIFTEMIIASIRNRILEKRISGKEVIHAD